MMRHMADNFLLYQVAFIVAAVVRFYVSRHFQPTNYTGIARNTMAGFGESRVVWQRV